MSPADDARDRRLVRALARRQPGEVAALVFLVFYATTDVTYLVLDWVWPTTNSPRPGLPVSFALAVGAYVKCRRLRGGAVPPDDDRGRRILAAFARRHPWRAALLATAAVYGLTDISFDVVDAVGRRYAPGMNLTGGRVGVTVAFAGALVLSIRRVRRVRRA